MPLEFKKGQKNTTQAFIKDLLCAFDKSEPSDKQIQEYAFEVSLRNAQVCSSFLQVLHEPNTHAFINRYKLTDSQQNSLNIIRCRFYKAAQKSMGLIEEKREEYLARHRKCYGRKKYSTGKVDNSQQEEHSSKTFPETETVEAFKPEEQWYDPFTRLGMLALVSEEVRNNFSQQDIANVEVGCLPLKK